MEKVTAERRARPQQPETIHIKGFILKDSYGGYRHSIWDPRIGDNLTGEVVVGEHVVEYSIPSDFNAIAAEVEALQAQVETEKRTSAQRVAVLSDRIAKLQCIEMAPAVGAAS